MYKISFIIPVKPDSNVLCLSSLSKFAMSSDMYEVIVVEGFAPSHQRNRAADIAEGDLLFFLDDDSILSEIDFNRLYDLFNDQQVSAVGGPSITPDTDLLQQHLWGYALASVFGSGTACNRYKSVGAVRETTERELILCNLVFRKSLFTHFGGFDTRLYPNEENELLDRMRSVGYKLIHDPEMIVYRSQRKSIKAFVKQIFSYGRGRAEQTRISGNISVISFIPLVFIVYCLSLACVNSWFWFIPLLLYLAFTVISTFLICIKHKKFYTLLMFIVFPIMHFVNGIGLLYGLFNKININKTDYNINIKYIKKFNL